MPSFKARELAKFRKRVADAEREYEDAVKFIYAVGSRASYSHGNHEIPCEIVHHGYSGRVQVRGDSGKLRWIDASRFV